MKIDVRLVTGIFIGVILGLHYHSVMISYMPLLMVPTLIMVLKVLHR